jgi:hypothetical protein
MLLSMEGRSMLTVTSISYQPIAPFYPHEGELVQPQARPKPAEESSSWRHFFSQLVAATGTASIFLTPVIVDRLAEGVGAGVFCGAGQVVDENRTYRNPVYRAPGDPIRHCAPRTLATEFRNLIPGVGRPYG